MNCANHPDREHSAFCQNCGKPLCTECIHTVGTSIFCEPCAVLHTTGAGPAGVPPVGPYGAPVVATPPSPVLAAILGIIPGVGAMYNGQYAKGIVHLMVFALLVSLADQNSVFGIFVAGWIAYMVFEAHHTARARRDGTPLPNPFGLNELSERLGFGKAWPSSPPPSTWVPPTGPADPIHPGASSSGFTGSVPPAGAPYPPPYTPPYTSTYTPPAGNWGAPQDAWGYPVPPVPPVPDANLPPARRFPAGAIWLIALGVIFLLGNTGLFFIRARFLGPLLLIAFGVWMFVRRMTSSGMGLENDGTPAYTWRLARAASGSIWLVATGFLWLLDVVGILSWSRSWPLFLIIGGLMLFLKRSLWSGYPVGGYGYPPYPGGPRPPAPPPPPASTSIVPVPERSITEEGR
jgi:TM2 domain-containing membrane protein YozV